MTSAAQGSDQMPEPVRARLVGLVSRGMALMPAAQIPAPLRKAASFTPAKRVRLVGSQIAARAASDDEFREHLAVQVRALEPELVQALESATTVPDDRLPDAAAVAFVVRPEGWEDVVASAAEAASTHREQSGELAAAVERLTAALDQAKGELKNAREKHRGQQDQLKVENAQLRRTLGQTRVQLKEAEGAMALARDALDEVERRMVESARAYDAEIRRLKARIAELESDDLAARRAVRDDRNGEVMRLRLLLDTMSDAAAGLRRELALPPTEGLPADTVVALEPASDSAAVGAGRAMPDDDPALLRRLIDLPRVHLIVDGYNVSKAAWPQLPLDQQRARLVSGLSAIVAGKAMETTVVFDGADLAHPPPVVSPRGVRVRFSPPGVIADDLIRQLVEAEPVGRPVVVVSTDREVARSVTKKGARAVASLALVRALGG